MIFSQLHKRYAPKQVHSILRFLSLTAAYFMTASTFPLLAQSGNNPLTAADGFYNIRNFGALPDGRTDNTAAIQKALDLASDDGGGVVLVPIGRWLCTGHLVIKKGAHLVGMNQAPLSWEPVTGSILLATEGRDHEDQSAFITMRTSTSISGITIYYPEQTVDNVRPYPWTIQINSDPTIKNDVAFDTTITDMTFINSYNGIRSGPNENGRHRIMGVHGCVLRRGIFVDWTGDIGRIENVQFHSHFWANEAFHGDWSKAFAFMQKNLEAFVFGRTDWEYVTNTFVFPARVGYHFIETSNGACNGQFSGIGADATDVAVLVDAIQPMGLLITNGEFNSHMVKTSIQIVISKSARGNVRFVNCGFWGPVEHNALLQGDGFTSFSDCYFSNDNEAYQQASILAEAGKIQVQNCTFGGAAAKHEGGHPLAQAETLHEPPSIHLGSGVRSAIIRGNNGLAGVKIENEIGNRAIISDNEPFQPR
jgi:hypothetical protein